MKTKFLCMALLLLIQTKTSLALASSGSDQSDSGSDSSFSDAEPETSIFGDLEGLGEERHEDVSAREDSRETSALDSVPVKGILRTEEGAGVGETRSARFADTVREPNPWGTRQQKNRQSLAERRMRQREANYAILFDLPIAPPSLIDPRQIAVIEARSRRLNADGPVVEEEQPTPAEANATEPSVNPSLTRSLPIFIQRSHTEFH